MADHSHLHCSFCGKPAAKVKKLIAGVDVYICDGCIDLCHNIIHDNKSGKSIAKSDQVEKSEPPPSPREIKEFLDEYVIGQDHAKEVLSVAVYNHYKRLLNPVIDGVEIEKSNVLLCGPTGVGKTLLAQTVARKLDVPFAIVDATALTEAGYVGEDVESIVGRLLVAADNDVRKAERGIIFIDEIDKKRAQVGGNGGRDVSGEGVQQALLKILEGTDVMVTANGTKKQPNSDLIKVSTRNILFIVGGAFVGLDKIVEKALDKESAAIGFGSKITTKDGLSTIELLRQVEPEHLVSFGLIPELIGRLPVISAFHDLSEEQLVRILTEPKNALAKQFAGMFKLEGVELMFDHEALVEIAKIARLRKTNGRALRGVMESRLLRLQYDLPDLRKAGATRVVINADTITKSMPPIVIYEPVIEVVDTVEQKPAD